MSFTCPLAPSRALSPRNAGKRIPRARDASMSCEGPWAVSVLAAPRQQPVSYEPPRRRIRAAGGRQVIMRATSRSLIAIVLFGRLAPTTVAQSAPDDRFPRVDAVFAGWTADTP